MVESNVFPGRLVLCGCLKSSRVRAIWGRNRATLYLSDGAGPSGFREELHLKPFTEDMLMDSIGSHACQHPQLAPRRTTYRFSGCDLGHLHHRPAGCAGDRDHEVQTVKAFSTQVDYDGSAFHIRIEGVTDAGYSVIHRGNTVQTRPVAPSHFRVAFDIRRERLRDFLSWGLKSFHHHAEWMERRQAELT